MYEVTVRASDGTLSEDRMVKVTVTPVNEAPEITVGGLAISGPASVNYAEDRQDAVDTYTARGENAASARWTLGGADRGDFTLSSTSGASVMLRFRSSPNYESPADADGDNTYMVTLKATADGEMDTQDVTVTVTDVEEDMVVGQTPLQRYDENDNGRIDKEELVEAIFDYNVNETLEKAQLVDLIFSYEFGN